ncbi:replication protein A 70 kDa DNA-binding subunit D [Capsella rubella]|nr:replication protein A 70 kDa DNA-binding subunit D [Capsella rubella]
MSMALPLSFTPLKDLKPYKNSWRIEVKILHSWRMFSAKSDVIGQVVSSGGIEVILNRNNKETKKIVFQLRDNDDIRLSCTLWGNYADLLNKAIHEANDGMVICLLRFVKQNLYKDTRYIENAFESSILLINPQIQEMESFKSILPNDGLALTINSSGDKAIYFPKDDNEGIDYPRVTISEMLGYSQAGNCRLICTISGIDTDMGWYYFCCRPCNKKVFKDDAVKIEDVKKPIKPRFWCEECDAWAKIIVPKYKLHLSIMDHTGESKCFLFDSWAKKILGGAPASEFLNGSFDEIEDPNAIPDQIKALVGKTFQFLITVGNENVYGGYEFYKVSNVWSGDKFIEIANEESESYLEHNSILSSDQASLMITNGTEPSETDLSSSSTPSSKRKSDSSGNGSDRSSSTKKLCSKIDTIHVDGEEDLRKDLNEEITRQEEDQGNK